ncbi:Oxidoreductase [Moritella sp. JT01]|uniref:SDR family oxidoreductase n=1 Tax=Moritella sp. JT01 TaxID=756698 RepID=UPI0007968372|nr:SDR family oxidoreductase [Moritella sp. JT01]KXO13475.1 Oxidoreductase [Moritella sp. JT01]
MIGKRILIIGGSSGIGLSLSAELLSQGADVVIASRSQEKLNAAESRLKGNISSYQLDASDEDSVIRFFDDMGKFDCLVSTIKPEHLICDFSDSKLEDTRKAFEAKFWGQYQLIRHCLKTISKEGCIILTSGIAANRGYKGFSGTAAINGAIESLVGSLSVELAPIRVNAVSPGFIERFNADKERLSAINSLSSRIPLKRLGTHAETSEAYLYLLKNKYSTGTILKIDGGELCA